MASKELKAILELLRSRPIQEELSIQERRREIENEPGFSLAEDVQYVVVDAGGIPGEWIYTQGVSEERVIYYLHGGAYVAGSAKRSREVISRISRAAEARALAIDYRLAPENPFPAAVVDAKSAYLWLLTTGVNPSEIVIAGSSSGGGLVVATLTALHDAGEPLPASGVCISPWVDMECSGESMTTKREADPMIMREDLLRMARAYLGEANPRTPLATPLYADLQGLPPLLIQVGTAEVLLDDATRLAKQAKAAGVDVTLEAWEDMFHVWHNFAPILPEGQQAIDHIGEFVRKHIKGS